MRAVDVTPQAYPSIRKEHNFLISVDDPMNTVPFQ